MPELPEVETVVRTLRPELVGRGIVKTEIMLAKIIKEPEPDQLAALIINRRITALSRRGKFIFLHLEGGYLLLVHLRMTGRLVVTGPEQERDKYTHVVFTLDDGSELRYKDIRKFGTISLIPASTETDYPPLAKLGPDALDPDLDEERFSRMLAGRKTGIKRLLLDQSFIAGLGNIYANEVLWRAMVRPDRRADTLGREESKSLYLAVRDTLQLAIAHRGTTLRDYVDGHGQPGGFQGLLQVHGKEGEPCPKCGHAIERLKIDGRSCFYCPCCQK